MNVKEIKEEEKNNSKLNIHKLFWYFVLFSIIGLVIETVYAYLTMGVLESRKGLIWGPFCPVYGVGGTVLILLLNKVDKNNYAKLFIYGFLIGGIIEYILSFGLEAIYGIRFWEYSYTGNDINGRICITYSLFWGILAILLMKFVRPVMDHIIEKISGKIKWPIEIIIFIFLVIDALVTIWGINVYQKRVINEYYGEKVEYSNISWIKNIEENYFTNKRMQRIFPNLRILNREGNQVYVRDLINNN